MVGHQSEVVEHRARIEQLAVELQTPMNARQRAEMIDTARMIEEQLGFGVADVFGDGAGKPAVGDGGSEAMSVGMVFS